MTRPLNYSTTVPARRTVGDCQDILAEAGADAVAVMFADRQPAGLSFQLDTPHGPRSFAMPVDVDAMAAVLAKMLRDNPPHVTAAAKRRLASREHAADVAWRVVKDWLEAQLALIAAQMASLDEVMLPFLLVPGGREGRTLYEAYRASEAAALPAGQP